MQKNKSGIGHTLAQGLRLSSDGTFEREKAVEADRSSYRRKYWQGYAKRVKRIFGTVTCEEYGEVQERADEAGRSVWGQVWAEARAYRDGRKLATGEIADQQRELIIELRRIGNNLNQLARLGHIKDSKTWVLHKSDRSLGAEAMRQLAQLEEVVTKFDDGITIRVRTEQVDDH